MPKYYDPLSDMSRIKEYLINLFLDKEDLANLIMPTLDDEHFTLNQNWLGGKYDKNIFGETEIKTLIGHCFDHPYIDGTVTDNRCAIFIETYLNRVENKHIKEVGLDVFIVCHKDMVQLSDEDKGYYHKIGVYGNRVDSAVQLINSALLDPLENEHIKKKYSIGEINMSERNPLKQYVPNTKFYGKCLSYTYQTFYQRKRNVR